MRKVFIEHITRYNYSNSVRYHANQVMLYPISNEFQKVNSHKLEVTSFPTISTYEDFFGNTIGTFNIIAPHNQMTVKSLVEITMLPKTIEKVNEEPKEQWAKIEALKQNISFFEYLSQTDSFTNTDVSSILPEDFKTLDPLDVCVILSQFIFENFSYQKGITNIESTIEEVWKLKAGVCQDFTNILLYLNRFFGIPSRYVSGYICPSDDSNFRGVGATHAWVEVYIPQIGWVGIDPTNNCITNGNHVMLSVGRDYKDCSPIKGVYSGVSTDQLEVSVVINDKNQFEASIATQKKEEIKEEISTDKVTVNSYAKHQEILIQQQQQQQ